MRECWTKILCLVSHNLFKCFIEGSSLLDSFGKTECKTGYLFLTSNVYFQPKDIQIYRIQPVILMEPSLFSVAGMIIRFDESDAVKELEGTDMLVQMGVV